MSSLQAEFNYISNNPAVLCPGANCSGWNCSDLDTWHRCPIHFRGQPHPEAAEAELDAWDAAEAARKLEREVYEGLRGIEADQATTPVENAYFVLSADLNGKDWARAIHTDAKAAFAAARKLATGRWAPKGVKVRRATTLGDLDAANFQIAKLEDWASD